MYGWIIGYLTTHYVLQKLSVYRARYEWMDLKELGRKHLWHFSRYYSGTHPDRQTNVTKKALFAASAIAHFVMVDVVRIVQVSFRLPLVHTQNFDVTVGTPASYYFRPWVRFTAR